MFKSLIVTIPFCLFSVIAFGQTSKTDSVRVHELKEVRVNGQLLQTARAAMPVQILDSKEFDKLNAVMLSDVVKHFSGINVKDYGGIGGLKTISLRGLGSQHTGVSYDGMMMSDVQSGQIDIGRFSLDNLSEISLSNGQPNDIFQSARMFSTSGVLCLSTRFPEYKPNEIISGKVTIRSGSFGQLSPNLLLQKAFSAKLRMNLSLDIIHANGKYDFVQNYNPTQEQGVKETLTRENGDVLSIRSEFNSLYQLKENETFSIKASYFTSERGLPASVIFFNSFNLQRLWDNTFLAQVHYQNKLSPKFQYQFLGKYNNVYNKYRDVQSNYPGDHVAFDQYRQQEYYISSTLLYRPQKTLSFSAAFDVWYNDLTQESTINFEPFAYPTRLTGLANIAIKYTTEKLSVGANILNTVTHETVQSGVAAPNRYQPSPTVNFSYKLLSNKELRLRAFYKNTFRLPTFNDLYFQKFGNHNLKPEETSQYNLGIIFSEKKLSCLTDLEMSADVFFNQVHNKIIAIPRDLFHWTMTNKGYVEIKGLDLNLKFNVPMENKACLAFRSNFNYQLATDKTKDSQAYGWQIPYTPYYSGACSLSYSKGICEAGYNTLFTGKRFTDQHSVYLRPYQEHSVFGTINYKQFKICAEIINIFNKQYEVVIYYPMPGRNYRFTISMNINKSKK